MQGDRATLLAMKLTAAYPCSGDWIAAWVEEIPGVHPQGKTMEEARGNLQEAWQPMLEANREIACKHLPESCVEEDFATA